jgi:hypothetical protein
MDSTEPRVRPRPVPVGWAVLLSLVGSGAILSGERTPGEEARLRSVQYILDGSEESCRSQPGAAVLSRLQPGLWA